MDGTQPDAAPVRADLGAQAASSFPTGAVVGFTPLGGSAAVVISAPRAKAEYHIDGPPSLLWHLRGQKRLWVYPALDWRFVAQEQLEEILAGTGHEYATHQKWFDAHAAV